MATQPADDETPRRFEDEYPEAAAALVALARGELIPPRPVHWTVKSDGTLIEYADKTRRVVIATTPGLQAGRNDPCPCGSGRKFKKCCLAR